MATLQDVIDEAKRNKGVCPHPQKWQELYEMLPDKKRKGIGWEPPLPLILAAWCDTPAISKMLRVRDHIQWAADHGCLNEVYDYLRALREEGWYHVGE